MAVLAIDGTAGIGKTALAVHAAHQLSCRYPDGQLFVDLHGFTEGVTPLTAAEALDQLLCSLGIPSGRVPPTVDGRAALYRSVLAGRRMLVLLDNAASESQVRPLLPASTGCLAVVTSRARLSGLDEASPLSLDVLPVTDAIELFTEVAGTKQVVDVPPSLLTQVVELCAGLPLAVRVAAARLRTRPTWTVATLLEMLRDEHDRLGQLSAGERSVTGALQVSYAQLPGEQRQLFRLLGLHPGRDVDVHAAAALSGSSVAEVAHLLDDLYDVHLLSELQADRYRFHDLLRAFAAQRAAAEEPADDRRAALARLFDHYAHAASTAIHLLHPYDAGSVPVPDAPGAAAEPLSFDGFDGAESAARWLDTERANLVTTATYAAEHGFTSHTLRMSNILHRHLRTGALHRDADQLHSHALTAAHRLGDTSGEIRALTGLGHALAAQRDPRGAECFQEALDLARAAGDPASEGRAHLGLGAVTRLHGRFDAAADHLRRGLELARETGDLVGERTALYNLGNIERLHGRLDAAIAHYDRSLAIAREIGDRTGEAFALHALGGVYQLRGDLDRAAAHLNAALPLTRSGPGEATLQVQLGLGDVYRAQGNHEHAADAYHQVLETARAVSDENSRFEALLGLGLTSTATDRPAEALEHLASALDVATSLNQPEDEARAHDGLARAHSALGNPASARHHWLRCLETLTDLGLPGVAEVNVDEVRTHLAELDPRPEPR